MGYLSFTIVGFPAYIVAICTYMHTVCMCVCLHFFQMWNTSVLYSTQCLTLGSKHSRWAPANSQEKQEKLKMDEKTHWDQRRRESGCVFLAGLELVPHIWATTSLYYLRRRNRTKKRRWSPSGEPEKTAQSWQQCVEEWGLMFVC